MLDHYWRDLFESCSGEGEGKPERKAGRQETGYEAWTHGWKETLLEEGFSSPPPLPHEPPPN